MPRADSGACEYGPKQGGISNGLKNLRVGLWVGGDDSGWRESSQRVYDTLAGISSVRVVVKLHVLNGQGHIRQGVSAAEVWDVITPPGTP